MLSRLNFNHLFYFTVVAREGSIKEAAKRLHVSQPSISDQIRLLETYLECNLFERKNRSLKLTVHGKLALEYAENIFKLSNDLTMRLRNDLNTTQQRILIGFTQSIHLNIDYNQFAQTLNSYDFQFNIRHDSLVKLVADLEAGDLDCIVTDALDFAPSHFEFIEIKKSNVFAIAHKKLVKGKKKAFPQNLQDLPFFSYTQNNPLKYEIDHYFSRQNLAPKTLGETDDPSLLDSIVQTGTSFIVVPQAAKERITQNKNIIVLGELPNIKTTLWGILKKGYQGQATNIIETLKKSR